MAANILQITYARAKADLSGNLVRAEILCDTAADLPAINAFSGYELMQGCKAHVIDENQDYMLDSGGSWHPYGGTDWQNVYTKTETDALLAAKQDELTTSRTDLLSYIDSTLIDTANSAFEIRRYGKTCFARISLRTITSALTGVDTINTVAIPSALRPEKSIYFPVVARNQAGWASATLVQTAISVDTSGNVILRTLTEKANVAYVTGYLSYYTL
jgi:hypothetical protein